MPGLAKLSERKARIDGIRRTVATRLDDGDHGLRVATTLGTRFTEFVSNLLDEELSPELKARTAVLGVGGTGRGVMCPYSDLDLMMLARPADMPAFEAAIVPVVQTIWDVDLKLGHSVRTPKQAIALAIEDDKTATSFLSTQCLWGDERLARQFRSQFRQRVVDRNKTRFVKRCVRARQSEFTEKHPASQMLEPNVKTSLGGLRDVQLVMWVCEAVYGTSDFMTVMLSHNMLSQADADRLDLAYEFLLRLRCQLHLWAKGPEDRLTRAAQLAIAEREDIESTESQRSVERLMQQYFQHTTAVAAISSRFVSRHQPRPLWRAVVEKFRERTVDDHLIVGPLRVDVTPQNRARATESIESMLRVYEVGASHNVRPSPSLSNALRVAAIREDNQRDESADGSAADPRNLALSPVAAGRVRAILDSGSAVSPTLRHMAQTGVLDLVLPEWKHLRGLLQFNQYHHFTVDEHTLRAVQIATSLQSDDSPVGVTYRNLRNRALLHLAVVMHDIGKGFDEDHCIVGEQIAAIVGPRFGFTEEECEQLCRLVRLHLDLSDLALRRDITDEKLLGGFAKEVGTNDTLAMLYVLTVADIKAVGPGTWTKWKGELLAETFRRVSVIISGKPYSGFEEAEIERAIEATAAVAVPSSGFGSPDAWRKYIREQLTSFSAYYLTVTSPEQIASDLATLRDLSSGEIDINGSYEATAGAYSFRVLLHESTAQFCFHQICGVLAARGFLIHSAEINTTTDGYVIDGFQARHPTNSDPPEQLIASTIADIRQVLLEGEQVTDVFHRHERYGVDAEDESLASGLTSRVEIDAGSSDTRLIVDVFTHSRRGLLYTLAKTLLNLNLDVDLAKIGTHFDQVIDVFYVTENDGSKPAGEERLREIRETVKQAVDEFQDGGFLAFRRSSTTLELVAKKP